MSDATSFVEGIVHEPTQTGPRGLDLTVADLHTVTQPGRVDFGGDELEATATSPLERHRRDPDDDYQWWHLDGGQYLIEYNESLLEDARVRIQVHDAVRERGGVHPTVTVASLGPMPLSVADGGLRLKENARVSTLTDVLDAD